MPDQIQVQVGTDNSQLLSGMKEAAQSVEEATKGMSGSVVQMLETMEKMGPAALGLAAVGLAFEGLKEGFNYLNESVEQTNKLTESFRSLGYVTGASQGDINSMTMAMEMSGGTVADLDGLMKGMSRAVKTNGEVLIANGMATDEAALRGMGFVEYLKKAADIADQMAPGQDRELFLMQALGRSGVELGDKLHEMAEHMKETEGKSIINPAQTQQLKECEAATGRLKIAQQQYAASVASSWAPIANWFTNLHAAWLETASDIALVKEAARSGAIEYTTDMDGEIIITDELIKKVKELAAARSMANNLNTDNDVGATKNKEGGLQAPKKKDITKEDLDKKKAAAAEAAEAAKKAAAEARKIEDEALQASIAASKQTMEQKLADLNQELVQKRINKQQEVAAEIEAVKAEAAAETAAVNRRIAQGNLAVGEKKKLEDEKVKITAEALLKITNLQTSAYAEAEKEAEKHNKLLEQIDKEGVREAEALAKDNLAAQKLALDAAVAQGKISKSQEVAARIALSRQELQMEISALQQELKDFKGTEDEKVLKAKQTADKIADLERKQRATEKTETTKATQDTAKTYQTMADNMTRNWSTGIAQMLNHQISFKDGVKKATQQMGQDFEQGLIKMGLDFIKFALLKAVVGEDAHMKQNMLAAKDAAGNAYQSAADIPVVGWILAPAAAAAAFAATAAFAEQGYDIPKGVNPMVQAHQEEMILPKPLANTVRYMAQAGADGMDGKNGQNGLMGGKNGGGIQFHISTLDSKNFQQMLSRPANARTLSQMAKQSQKQFGRI